MARMLKCYGERCELIGAKYEEHQLKVYSGKRYCSSCYSIKETESIERKKLNDYICKIFNIPYVDGRIMSDIKKLKIEGKTLSEIRFTLYYYVTILQRKPLIQYGIITVVRNNYQAMLHYRAEKKEKEKQMTGVSGIKPVTFKIKPPKRRYDYKEDKMINMEELANGIEKY